MKRRMAVIHWWRAKNLWSVRFSDHCEHYKRLVISAPLEALLDTKGHSPRAYLHGRVICISHGEWAEIA